MEGPADGPVSRGAEGDREVEEPVEDAGPPGGQEVQTGGAGFSYFCRCEETGAGRGGGQSK